MIRTAFHLRSSLFLNTPTKPLFSAATSFLISLSSRFSSSPILERRHPSSNNDEFNEEHGRPPRLFVVQPRIRPEAHLRWKLDEALNLANSLEEQRDGFYDTEFIDKETPPHLVVQNPMAKSPRADTYFGPGTVGNIKCHLNDLESKDGVDAVFVNAILTGVQQRNLERVWGKPVLDRIALIIEIFNAHAQTKEAKLQSDLAALTYKRSRLVRVRGLDGRYTFGEVGEAEVVSARGRGSGGRGFISGAGETELQLQHRRLSDRKKKLLSEIAEVRRTRAVQRAARKKAGVDTGQGIAIVAVVGYTNAGKSTLVSSLSNSHLFCDDRLFATVDPKLRSVDLPSGRKVLLSDTVGFISDLPIQLVEAFHATLEEVVEADLLVHVLDSSAPNLDEHRKTVMQVLGQIGVPEEKLRNMIEVWNKVDILEKNSEMGGFDRGIDLSDEEDADVTTDQSTDQPDGEQDIVTELSQDLGDCSDGWLSLDDEPNDSWVDYKAQSIGCDAVKSPEDELTWHADKALESSCHVRTSAVTGVGLQELLEMIEKKLPLCRVVETSVFDRKWRPPRGGENNTTAVEVER